MAEYDPALAEFKEPLKSMVARFLVALGKTTDLTLITLRGHLLLEELLWRGILTSLLHPQHLEKARLDFRRLSALFKALHGDGEGAQYQSWAFLVRLNDLRNSLAHRIDVPHLESEIDALIALMGTTTDARIAPGQERAYFFTLALGHMGGRLSSVLASSPPQPICPKPTT